MRFQALELALDAIHQLADPLRRIRRTDRALHDQLRRAASSVALNLAESRRRSGRDRQHLIRVAAGSADETITALRVAAAWGEVDARATAAAIRSLDRVLAICWTLTH